MSAPKPLLVLLVPAFLAVPCALVTSASAQEKTAPATSTDASLTKTASPATTIAPRQSLPAFTSVKLSVAPVLATPTTARQTLLTPPVAVKTSAIKEAALPAPALKVPVAAWSAAERAQLVTSTLASATPPIVKQRRAFAAAVSLSTSPDTPVKLAPQVSVAPETTVAAPVSVSVMAPLTAPVTAPVAAVARPSILASREARAREVALARMDAQLAGAEGRLDRAQSRLTEGQRQLGNVSNLLQSAMLSSGGSGLHPFVRVAQRYLGTPYVWGGESARGFDCSGFIMRVMRDLGYKALPHSAAEQFNYGQPISKGLLQPGDIVFFANTYKPGISHVGIYLGGGRFIHAANSQVGTIESNLNSPKWVAHYAGARRLMKMS